jgi:AcrR family transcriptional regulator
MSDLRAPRWRRRPGDRPAEIIRSALSCFGERGFLATRLDDVAARAGVTKGTLYLYFPSKDALFKAVVRETLVRAIERLEAALDNTASDPPEALRHLVGGLAALVQSPAGVVPKLVIAEASRFPDLARFYVEEVVQRGLALIARTVAHGIESGAFRPVDPQRTALCIVAPQVVAALLRHGFEPHTGPILDLAGLGETATDLLLHALAKGDAT